MKCRSIGGCAELLCSSYSDRSTKLVLASEYIVKETIAIKVGDDVTLMNDDNIEYYSILNKKGLGSWKSATAHTLLYFLAGPIGTLGATAIDVAAGGKYKRQLIFVKFKSGEKILILVEDGKKYLLRSKRKISADNIEDVDIQWIKRRLEEYSNPTSIKVLGKNKDPNNNSSPDESTKESLVANKDDDGCGDDML